jgi:hypothetical protein
VDCEGFRGRAPSGLPFFVVLISALPWLVERVVVDDLGRPGAEGPALWISFLCPTPPSGVLVLIPLPLPLDGLGSSFFPVAGIGTSLSSVARGSGDISRHLSAADDVTTIGATARFASMETDDFGPCLTLSSLELQ